MRRLMVLVALMVGGLLVLTQRDVLTFFFCISGKGDWQHISLSRANISVIKDLEVGRIYEISISGRDISIDDIYHLKRLRGIRALALKSFPQLDGVFLRSLASFDLIHKLWLVDVPMDDQTMEAIRDMTGLRSLSLRSNDEGRQLPNLELLLPLTKVETLGLDGWRLTADNARVVGSLANLRVLELYADGVADFLDGIPRGNGIKVLDLQAAIVEPRALRTLIEWENLRVLIFPSADNGEYASKTAELRKRGVKVVTDT